MELKVARKLERDASQFQTDRLTLDTNRGAGFEDVVKGILTPAVTEYLPDGWQNLSTSEQIKNWIADRSAEGAFLNIRMEGNIIGFCFIYVPDESAAQLDLRFGYLLSQEVWGQGIGTEFIEGLIAWCTNLKSINSISGGVEVNNKGSIRVLEKNGFVQEDVRGGTLFYRLGF